MMEIVFFEGKFVSPDDARIRVTDRGYLLGDGVFATLRAYEGVCFRPEQHVETLLRGASLFGLDVPKGAAELVRLADETARRSECDDAYVRITLTHGGILSVYARPTDPVPASSYAEGIRACVVDIRRAAPSCIDGSIKTTSYAPQLLAQRQALSRGADDGILLSTDGAIACATMANIFVVEGAVLYTPSLDTGCRDGVTRRAVIEIAPSMGLRVEEARLEVGALREADEVFLTSTRVECVPVASLDGRPIGNGKERFSRTHALRAALRQCIASETNVRRSRVGEAHP